MIWEPLAGYLTLEAAHHCASSGNERIMERCGRSLFPIRDNGDVEKSIPGVTNGLAAACPANMRLLAPVLILDFNPRNRQLSAVSLSAGINSMRLEDRNESGTNCTLKRKNGQQVRGRHRSI
jgi:hypothetical protein